MKSVKMMTQVLPHIPTVLDRKSFGVVLQIEFLLDPNSISFMHRKPYPCCLPVFGQS